MNYMHYYETLKDNFMINIVDKLKVLLISDLLLINIEDIKRLKGKLQL